MLVRPVFRRESGFSLIELAVVLIILSVLLAIGLSALNAQITKQAYEETFARRDIIKQSMITYLRLNKRLPCPSNPAQNGLEAVDAGGNCNAGVVAVDNFGIIPWRTLGLDPEVALDGWDSYFSYMVSDAAGQNWTANTGITAGTSGALIRRTTDVTAPPATLDTAGFAVALISHGPNALGGFTAALTPGVPAVNAEETMNAGDTADTFREDVPTPTFDDIVLSLTADELRSQLIQDGVIEDPNKETRAAVDKQVNELLGQLMQSRQETDTASPGCDAVNPCSQYTVPACPGTLPVDSWTTALRCYTSAPATIQLNTTGGSSVIKVYSAGSDVTDDGNAADNTTCTAPAAGNDDICRAISVNELVGQLTSQDGFR
jgi:prepilin-type N-terminal cleavage/methylation domain-containing protein